MDKVGGLASVRGRATRVEQGCDQSLFRNTGDEPLHKEGISVHEQDQPYTSRAGIRATTSETKSLT